MKLYDLYFINWRQEEKLLLENSSTSTCMRKISTFLDEHNFKSFYTRSWEESDGCVMIDVGSHTEFFKLKPLN